MLSSTVDSIRVTYSISSGKRDRYSVRCYNDPADIGRVNPPVQATVSCQNPPASCICTNLTPGQRYKIEVTTIRSGFISQTAAVDGSGATGQLLKSISSAIT